MKSKYNYTGGNNSMFYDRQYNLLYIFVYPQVTQQTGGLLSKKTSSRTDYSHISNIVLWDIPKQTKTKLFAPGELEGEHIRSITFEQKYDQENQCIIFNNSTGIWNNVEVFEREIRDKLLIETYHIEKEESYLWISDKWGFEKQRVATIRNGAKWHLDVWNSTIRIVEPKENDIELINIDW
ncbi:MAG: hypothetical protein GY810_31905 [Aureispira sp.]|nr:hypothetical protein [Aureispira sp.]